MRYPFALARNEKLTLSNISHTKSPDGGVNEDYTVLGECRGTFIPFGRALLVRMRDEEVIIANSAHFFLDVRSFKHKVSPPMRITRADGTIWEINQAVGDAQIMQVTVDQVS